VFTPPNIDPFAEPTFTAAINGAWLSHILGFIRHGEHLYHWSTDEDNGEIRTMRIADALALDDKGELEPLALVGFNWI